MFEDLYSRKLHVAFLKAKSDAFESYKHYEAWVKVHHNPSGIVCLGTDRGGEFLDGEFTTYLQDVRTIHHLNVYDSPQSNGAVERLNQTLVESARTMLFAANLPPFLWAEAIHHTAWLHAWIPSRALPGCMTPIERATGQKPNLKKVLAFGAIVWVKVKDAGKLDPQAVDSYFVGYDKESKGYHLYFPKCRHIAVKHDVYFDKEAIIKVEDVVFEGETTQEPVNLDFSNPMVANKDATLSAPENLEKTDKNVPEVAHETVPIPSQPSFISKLRRNSLSGLPQFDPDKYRCGKARRTATRHRVDEMTLIIDGDGEGEVDNVEEDDALAVCFRAAVYALSATEDQPIVETAINGPESNDWKSAIEAELTQIKKLGTWEFVEPPNDTNIVPCCWVLRRKRNAKAKSLVIRPGSLPKVFDNNSASITLTPLHQWSVHKSFESFWR